MNAEYKKAAEKLLCGITDKRLHEPMIWNDILSSVRSGKLRLWKINDEILRIKYFCKEKIERTSAFTESDKSGVRFDDLNAYFVEAIKNGDKGYFEAFIRAYEPVLQNRAERFVAHYNLSADDTEDIKQIFLEVLDTDKKTILHIPSVNSGESTKDKYIEVDTIIDAIGTVDHVDSETNIIFVSRKSDGKIIKVADLVNDNVAEREKVVEYLRNVTDVDDVDLIIALGMAKEGFDWPYCEHALTVGYRGSLTEIIQIIGRCTRDSNNKTHAQFTNLIAEPDAESEEVVESVNNMLKAITASLLMEQVLAPNFNFKPKPPEGSDEDKADDARTIRVGGMRQPSTQNVKNILDSDLTDLKANILQDPQIARAVSGVVDPEVINTIMIPKIIMTKYPHLSEDEVEEVREHLVADMVIRGSNVKTDGNRRFIDMSGKFVNLDELNIDLIDSINPFQQAFEVISKSITPKILKSIQECIAAFKVNMTDDEAIYLWPKINEFVKVTRRQPSLDALDPTERRLAEALIYLRQLKRDQKNG